MFLRDWRLSRDKTLRDLADELGIAGGVNPSRTVQRLETGEALADADMIERISIVTKGAVTAADMYAVRLAWLKEHKPGKFVSSLASSLSGGEAA